MSEGLPKSPETPSELARIYGDTVPARVLEMYAKLKGKKKESYLAMLAADEAEKKKKRESRQAKQTKEKPFDPHSVASIQTVEEQKQTQKIRAYLARAKIIPQESVQPKDVDIRSAYAPQYRPNPEMQGDKDRLANEEEQSPLEGSGERTPQEWREELRKTIEGGGNSP